MLTCARLLFNLYACLDMNRPLRTHLTSNDPLRLTVLRTFTKAGYRTSTVTMVTVAKNGNGLPSHIKSIPLVDDLTSSLKHTYFPIDPLLFCLYNVSCFIVCLHTIVNAVI